MNSKRKLLTEYLHLSRSFNKLQSLNPLVLPFTPSFKKKLHGILFHEPLKSLTPASEISSVISLLSATLQSSLLSDQAALKDLKRTPFPDSP